MAIYIKLGGLVYMPGGYFWRLTSQNPVTEKFRSAPVQRTQ